MRNGMASESSAIAQPEGAKLYRRARGLGDPSWATCAASAFSESDSRMNM